MSYRWGATPPPRVPDPSIRILTVQVGYDTLARLLGPPEAALTHWLGQRSVGCVKGHCPYCGAFPLRYKAYVACVSPVLDPATGQRPWQRRVLELTTEAASQVEHLPQGATLRLWRRGKAKTSAIGVELYKAQSKEKLPPAFDVKPYLERVWGHVVTLPAAVEDDDQGGGEVIPLPPPGSPERRARRSPG